MKIGVAQVGELMTNCYIVWDEETNNAAVIDPGGDAEVLHDRLQQNHLTLKYILLTHGHNDHIGGVAELRELCGTQPPVYISQKDIGLRSAFQAPVKLDPDILTFWDEGDSVTLDSITFRVIATPGHTPGSVSLITDDVIFSGDTLFQGSCGRTDLPGGDWNQMCASLKRLYELPGDYTVLSGHTGSTTLERERQTNAYMKSALA